MGRELCALLEPVGRELVRVNTRRKDARGAREVLGVIGMSYAIWEGVHRENAIRDVIANKCEEGLCPCEFIAEGVGRTSCSPFPRGVFIFPY